MIVDRHSEVSKNIDSSLKSFAKDKNHVDFDYQETHDNLGWESSRILQIFRSIDEHLKLKKPITILEVGIGYGMVTTGLSTCYNHEDMTIHAIEHPDRMYLKSEVYLSHLNKTMVNLNTFDITNEKWDYKTSMFDIVILSETVEHIPPTRLPFVLEQISRILKLNGILICTTPNLGEWRNRWKMLRGKSPFDMALPLSWAPGSYAHIRLYTVKEIISLCNIYSLKTEHFKYMNFRILHKRGLFSFLQKQFYKLFPATSPEFLIMARKVK